jgi:tetratricopeptide (TPR) repeat protein
MDFSARAAPGHTRQHIAVPRPAKPDYSPPDDLFPDEPAVYNDKHEVLTIHYGDGTPVNWRGYERKAVIIFAILCGFVTVLHATNSKNDQAATAAFEKLENESLPQADSLYQCSVTQLGVIKNGSGRRERAAAVPRDAYCRFLLALVTSDKDALRNSPALLAKAQRDGHNRMTPLLEVLVIVARLKNGANDVSGLPSAIARVDCGNTGFVNERTCGYILNAARIWSHLEVAGNPARVAYADGLRSFDRREWRLAAGSLNVAAQQWSSHPGPADLSHLLAPPVDLAGVLAKLGYAQFMDNNLEAALAALDGAIAARPDDSESLYVRSRIRDMLGLPRQAVADLEAAARTDQTHFSEGVLLVRQGKATEAAEAFAKAPVTTPDLEAWKLLASGCNSSADRLAAAANSATRLFPRQEATRAALECQLKSATTMEQLISLDPELRDSYADRVSQERISNAYLKFGLDAEDHHDKASAISAYVKSIEWLSLNTKARFNLAAIYIGDQKFELAEPQYRALLQADSTDYESQFWLAQCLLVFHPDAGRKAQACTLLQHAMQIEDSARRAEFAAVAGANCAK